MSIVRIPPTLRPDANGEREVPAAGSTVGEVLNDVAERFPALRARIFENGNIARFVNVYVGGEDIRTQDGLETPVDDDATVILLPAMAGGGS
jgi:molybdopterin synthase sulfur carrier subunit